MPTYEYACASCHRHTEAVQSFTDPPLTECPHCGGRLKRVFHPVGIVLKGSGFYSTDNRSGRKTTEPPAKETGKESKEPAAKTDTSSKPASSSSEGGGSTNREKTDTKSKPAKKAKS